MITSDLLLRFRDPDLRMFDPWISKQHRLTHSGTPKLPTRVGRKGCMKTFAVCTLSSTPSVAHPFVQSRQPSACCKSPPLLHVLHMPSTSTTELGPPKLPDMGPSLYCSHLYLKKADDASADRLKTVELSVPTKIRDSQDLFVWGWLLSSDLTLPSCRAQHHLCPLTISRPCGMLQPNGCKLDTHQWCGHIWTGSCRIMPELPRQLRSFLLVLLALFLSILYGSSSLPSDSAAAVLEKKCKLCKKNTHLKLASLEMVEQAARMPSNICDACKTLHDISW